MRVYLLNTALIPLGEGQKKRKQCIFSLYGTFFLQITCTFPHSLNTLLTSDKQQSSQEKILFCVSNETTYNEDEKLPLNPLEQF